MTLFAPRARRCRVTPPCLRGAPGPFADPTAGGFCFPAQVRRRESRSWRARDATPFPAATAPLAGSPCLRGGPRPPVPGGRGVVFLALKFAAQAAGTKVPLL